MNIPPYSHDPRSDAFDDIDWHKEQEAKEKAIQAIAEKLMAGEGDLEQEDELHEIVINDRRYKHIYYLVRLEESRIMAEKLYREMEWD